MSLIHAALEKMEQEKKELPEKIRPKENSRALYGIVVALVFCFTVGIIYLFAGSTPREEPSKIPAAATAVFSRPNQGRFVLTGITRAGEDRTAIVNNELVRVGDGVSGAQVMRIEAEKVILDDRGRTITLSL